jgi:alkylation response protein AidB-like acyl-CoA dehydrogenase
MMELAVAYAKTRVQSGRTIGSFQAVKHRCAEMAVDVEAARSAAYHAIATAAHEPTGNALAIAAAIAHSYCSEAFTRVTADCIQVHGGIGFTWEPQRTGTTGARSRRSCCSAAPPRTAARSPRCCT